MADNYSFDVLEEFEGLRVDKFLSENFDDFSRSFIQKLLKEENIFVNNKSVKPSYKLNLGDVVYVKVPDIITPDIVPQNIPLNVIYEDNDIILINKPKGMVVHPAPGHYTDTLVNALMYHCNDDLSGINGVQRPGIVHRIDMNTTGVIIACKNDFSHNHVAKQLKDHSITRKYEAITFGVIKSDEGTINAPIGRNPKDRKKMSINNNGREAVTHFKVLERYSKYSYIECQLETGRTHQIRVHLSSIHHPLLGDEVYGPNKQPYKLSGQALHAKTLGLIHPRTNKYIEFTAPLPEYFTNLIKNFKIHNLT